MYDKLKNLYNNCPMIIKKVYSAIPFYIRCGSHFRSTYKLLKNSQNWKQEEIYAYQCDQLQKLINHSYQNVPYYKAAFERLGLKPNDIKDKEGLKQIGFLTKDICMDNMEDLTSRNLSKYRMFYDTTGGTSGKMLRLYVSNTAYQKEWAFMITQWNRVGYKPSDRKVTLRGVPFKEPDKIWQYNPIYNQIELSPFHLSEANLGKYIDVIRDFSPKYIHGYPSAGAILAKYLIRNKIKDFPKIKAFLACSENVYEGQRNLIEEAFQTRFFSWYGLTEKVILAGECEYSRYYHIFPEYGITELIDQDGRVIEETGKVGELVGTGFLNYAMPLIRYRTSDYAEYVDAQCECGRKYRLIKNVFGRRIQEVIVGKDDALISLTAINLHSKVFDNVERFQFYQDKRGEAILRIVKAAGYNIEDETGILKALKSKMGNNLDIKLQYVDNIDQSTRGKSIFLIQKLDIDINNFLES